MALTRTTPLAAAEKKRLKALIKYEKQARQQGYKVLAGIDEAGRGPLAGPVVAAACIIPEGIFFDGVDDSKKLTADQREVLFDRIHSHPEVRFGIAMVDALEIDRLNIYQATIKAMLQAVANLPVEPDYLLVDGMNLPHPHISCLKIIKGDALSQSIAAASILAKVTRDRLMEKFHEEWPHYGFKQHKGYATEIHLEAILKHGPCPIHRMSFSPMRKEPVDAFKEQLLPFFEE